MRAPYFHRYDRMLYPRTPLTTVLPSTAAIPPVRRTPVPSSRGPSRRGPSPTTPTKKPTPFFSSTSVIINNSKKNSTANNKLNELREKLRRCEESLRRERGRSSNNHSSTLGALTLRNEKKNAKRTSAFDAFARRVASSNGGNYDKVSGEYEALDRMIAASTTAPARVSSSNKTNKPPRRRIVAQRM